MFTLKENPGQAETGGRLIVDSLLAHGVETVFCVPGESFLEIMDALYDVSDRIKLISCRHEHGAANMAEAYAKLTGKTGVCLVTRGPGACNASIGVHTARQDSTPMLLLIGQAPRPFLGREAFQEVDLKRMFVPLAKGVEQVEDVSHASQVMCQAFQSAQSGRPGPVVLSLCEDMLRQLHNPPSIAPIKPERATPGASDILAMHKLLAGAVRPMMIVGGGGWTAQGRADILAFVQAHGLPVCTSFRRNDLIDNRHAHYAGELGIAPNPTLLERIKSADIILAVGARLCEITSQGYTLPLEGQTLIHVHADAGQLGLVFKPTLAIHSDPNMFAAAALTGEPVIHKDRAQWRQDVRQDYVESLVPQFFAGPLDLGKVMVDMDRLLPEDAIITVDAGNFSGWPQRFLSFGGGRRLLGPTSGAMGYGVPAAVAAKIACPDRCVVGFAGDGGFGMTGQELATAILYGAQSIIIVFNNRMYGTIRMHQERRHPDRVIGTDLQDVNFAEIAQAYGAYGQRVERTEDFMPAFERAKDCGKAALVELCYDPQIITTRKTLNQLKGTDL